MNSGTYWGQSPSHGGICWHPVTERDNGHSSVPAGQTRKTPGNNERPQQDSNLRSRLRRRRITSFEFVHPACLDSITYFLSGRDHSAYIPDHGYFRRDCPHLAGDGPRPVRAGSRLALGL